MGKLRQALIGALVFVLAFGLVGQVVEASGPKVKLLIGFTEQPGSEHEKIVRDAGGDIKYTFHIVPVIAASGPESMADVLRQHPKVTHVHIDGRVWAIDAELDNSWGVKRIGAGAVHSYNKGTGVKVAIIDTGIDYSHKDLDANYRGGYDFVNTDTDPMDDNGHGTHVAGTVAAEDNDIDTSVVGVAPEAALYALKVLDETGGGYWSDVIAAIEWSVDNGMQVINMSLGGTGTSDVEAVCQAAYDAGLLLVAAAGNSGNPPGKGDNIIDPAGYASVIAVAATDKDDTRATWSSTGPDMELSAPGVDINSTLLGGGYGEKDGTSMACPHVAGTAALVWIAYPSWTNADVRTQLQNTADDLGATGWDPKYGYGLVDADEAAPPAVGAPTVSITSPADGSTFHVNESITFEGTASDTEDGDLTADLSWNSSIDDFIGTGGSFSATLSEGEHTITASVTDSGGNTGSASISIAVVNDAPVVTILQPADGATFDSGASITFEGTASDTEDGNLTASLVWTSSIDDQIGTGASVSTILSDGNHTITAEVTDSGAKTGSSSISIAVGAPSEPTTVSVSSITYDTQGGRYGNLHLLITVALTDDLGNPVADASVSIDVLLDGSFYGSGTGTTGTDGTVTFKATNAPSGTYSITVTNVTAEGLTWDGVTPDNSFEKT